MAFITANTSEMSSTPLPSHGWTSTSSKEHTLKSPDRGSSTKSCTPKVSVGSPDTQNSTHGCSPASACKTVVPDEYAAGSPPCGITNNLVCAGKDVLNADTTRPQPTSCLPVSVIQVPCCALLILSNAPLVPAALAQGGAVRRTSPSFARVRRPRGIVNSRSGVADPPGTGLVGAAMHLGRNGGDTGAHIRRTVVTFRGF